jgi:putative SOS response-associated peptidase YedK
LNKAGDADREEVSVMCGRFFIDTDDIDPWMASIIAEVNFKYANTPALGNMSRGEIFPTNTVPVLAAENGACQAFLMSWGFARYDGKGRVINARSETAGQRPMFRESMLKRRCLIPARHYYEWKANEKGNKTKYAIGFKDRSILYLAGLYRPSPGFKPADNVPEFVILTRSASSSIASIHDRMPVLVPECLSREWLQDIEAAAKIFNLRCDNLSATYAG